MLAKNIDVQKIRYGPVKKNQAGGKSVWVNYAGEKLVIQFPTMHMPYGINDGRIPDKNGKRDESKAPNYSISLSFKGKDDNKALGNLFTKLQEIEEKIKKDVFANRVTWLNDRYDDMDVVVSKLFSSNMQFDKDRETKKILNRYPPTFRIKVPSVTEAHDDGSMQTTFRFDASDMENNEIQFQNILSKLKGGKAQLIAQLVGLWFAGGKYGCTWKVLSGRFQVPSAVKYNYVEDSDDDSPLATKATDEDDDENDDDLAADAAAALAKSPPPAPTKPAPTKAPVTFVEESEEEEEEVDEEEEEEEEEPTPPPPPPKKTVKKTAGKK